VKETPTSLYIIMEYICGRELFEYIIYNKKLSELEACKLYQQIISGIEYLGKIRVVHRDLKPENLLLDNKKRILITDFGLSILSENYNQQLSTPCGTPSYSPPEMLKGKKYNGVCSDIWSCGIILYTMLVGNLPCSESKEELLYQNIITHNFYYPENLSDDAIDLIEHLLKINPKERYNFDEIKAHPWFNILTPKLRPGIVFEVHKIPIDPKILDKAKEMGYDQKKVEESVSKSKYDSFSAVYYLILKKFKKDGINSISDFLGVDSLIFLKKVKIGIFLLK
jgi:5'-AMP-activated protein kinase catalytic alpha subunit